MTEDKYKNKYRELKRRIREIEDENDVLNIRIHKARKSINRLRLERTFLLERMEKIQNGRESDQSDGVSDLLSHDGLDLGIRFRGKRARMVDKAPRKKKDPNAPKGPGNVFFLFCRLERDKVKDAFPQENLGDVTKLLGQKWKNLKKDEKQKYYDMYRKEMEEYEEAMKSYQSSGAPPPSRPETDIVAAEAEDAAAAAVAGEEDEEEEIVEVEAETEAEAEAAARAATGVAEHYSTLSSPAMQSSALASPEPQSDPIHEYEDDYEENTPQTTLATTAVAAGATPAPVGGLATVSSESSENNSTKTRKPSLTSSNSSWQQQESETGST